MYNACSVRRGGDGDREKYYRSLVPGYDITVSRVTQVASLCQSLCSALAHLACAALERGGRSGPLARPTSFATRTEATVTHVSLRSDAVDPVRARACTSPRRLVIVGDNVVVEDRVASVRGCLRPAHTAHQLGFLLVVVRVRAHGAEPPGACLLDVLVDQRPGRSPHARDRVPLVAHLPVRHDGGRRRAARPRVALLRPGVGRAGARDGARAQHTHVLLQCVRGPVAQGAHPCPPRRLRRPPRRRPPAAHLRLRVGGVHRVRQRPADGHVRRVHCAVQVREGVHPAPAAPSPRPRVHGRHGDRAEAGGGDGAGGPRPHQHVPPLPRRRTPSLLEDARRRRRRLQHRGPHRAARVLPRVLLALVRRRPRRKAAARAATAAAALRRHLGQARPDQVVAGGVVPEAARPRRDGARRALVRRQPCAAQPRLAARLARRGAACRRPLALLAACGRLRPQHLDGRVRGLHEAGSGQPAVLGVGLLRVALRAGGGIDVPCRAHAGCGRTLRRRCRRRR
eukprot:Rhum_TRINITY_DN14798_c15_g1::Rhum_TRINITY_DN14798_c15_g1_i2::g.111058::m.111058